MKQKYLFVLIAIMLLITPTKVSASTSSASSYVLMDMNTNRVLASKNAHNSKLIASISKIMTCILAIENKNLDDIVVVDETINEAHGSGIYIEVGEEMTLRDLLYGLMLRSGNDAAVMIAKYVAGSIQDFVTMMNEKAKELGMTNTTFNNPSGLDDDNTEGNYSSCYDMALLTSYAMQNEDYRTITKTKKHIVKTNKKTYSWTNKNKLLSYDYITGGKTGYTKNAGRTLVSTAHVDDMDLVVVTIRDGDDWNTHKELYEYAENNYESYKVLNKENYQVFGDTYYNGNLYIKEDVYVTLKEDETGNLISHVKLTKLKNYQNNEEVGVNEIYLDDKLLTTTKIYVHKNQEEEKKSFWETIFSWFKL